MLDRKVFSFNVKLLHYLSRCLRDSPNGSKQSTVYFGKLKQICILIKTFTGIINKSFVENTLDSKMLATTAVQV